MSSRIKLAGIVVSAPLLMLLFAPSDPLTSQEIRHVLVTNFPGTQEIEGTVSVDGPVRLSQVTRKLDTLVPPVPPDDTTRLVQAGTVVTEGFANVVLSLHLEVKGAIYRQGEVGAFLIPDEPRILNAFNEQGLLHFPLQVAATGIAGSSSYFASDQPRYQVGFQRYKVYMYNTTDKTVVVDLYAYLTN